MVGWRIKYLQCFFSQSLLIFVVWDGYTRPIHPNRYDSSTVVDESTPESTHIIPEVESGKQCVKTSSTVYRKSNRALTYRKSKM